MHTPFAPIEDGRKTLASKVHERIREAILTQVLKPGTRIDQNQMAEYLNVSLAPVREALKGLEAEGLVTIVPRRGAFVTEVSLSDLNELYFARALLEGETIYHAVEYLSDAELNELQKLIDRMKRVDEGGEVGTYIALNREFHLRIYSALNNQHLLMMIRNLWERSELYRYHYMLIPHEKERVHREHQAILDACRQRDRDAAREAAASHIRRTQFELTEYFENGIATK
jgi:DNA-binding GntR family transcriptional regulator